MQRNNPTSLLCDGFDQDNMSSLPHRDQENVFVRIFHSGGKAAALGYMYMYVCRSKCAPTSCIQMMVCQFLTAAAVGTKH